jgi:gamma-glutamyltranspeptidase/glutathione hydrolase
VQPGKRPFLTPNPGLALKEGRLFMAFGTPGTDTQPQAMVQLLTNMVDFGMDLQAAIEAPRFATYSFPRANDPHEVEPASLYLEARFDPAVADALRARGHDVRPWPPYTSLAGELCAIVYDPATETFIAAADPRRLCYAIGW